MSLHLLFAVRAYNYILFVWLLYEESPCRAELHIVKNQGWDSSVNDPTKTLKVKAESVKLLLSNSATYMLKWWRAQVFFILVFYMLLASSMHFIESLEVSENCFWKLNELFSLNKLTLGFKGLQKHQLIVGDDEMKSDVSYIAAKLHFLS